MSKPFQDILEIRLGTRDIDEIETDQLDIFPEVLKNMYLKYKSNTKIKTQNLTTDTNSSLTEEKFVHNDLSQNISSNDLQNIKSNISAKNKTILESHTNQKYDKNNTNTTFVEKNYLSENNSSNNLQNIKPNISRTNQSVLTTQTNTNNTFTEEKYVQNHSPQNVSSNSLENIKRNKSAENQTVLESRNLTNELANSKSKNTTLALGDNESDKSNTFTNKSKQENKNSDSINTVNTEYKENISSTDLITNKPNFGIEKNTSEIDTNFSEGTDNLQTNSFIDWRRENNNISETTFNNISRVKRDFENLNLIDTSEFIEEDLKKYIFSQNKSNVAQSRPTLPSYQKRIKSTITKYPWTGPRAKYNNDTYITRFRRENVVEH